MNGSELSNILFLFQYNLEHFCEYLEGIVSLQLRSIHYLSYLYLRLGKISAFSNIKL